MFAVSLRVFVYDWPDATGIRQVGHVVNPILRPAPAFATLASDPEGCLSVPGQRAVLARPGLAIATGADLHGKAITVSGTGTLARCLQHEADHVDGIVYVDRMPADKRREILTAAGLTN